ncbi:MAG: T9SS type A sorting domain-containing protein [Bacteroidetes bacterium]|nr:T9SS type A sorting domain-containing protein [Bacteroidota bacterium]
MNRVFLIAAIFISINLTAQTIIKESIDSGGGVLTETGVKIVQTIGEVMITEKSNGNLLVSEGFITPEIAKSLDVAESYDVLQAILFPNPTSSGIVNIQLPVRQSYVIDVFDLSGKEVIRKVTSEYNVVLNFSELPNSTYVVIIKSETERQISISKIVKN